MPALAGAPLEAGIPIIGPIVGLLAAAYVVYQGASGVLRIRRGIGQLSDASKHPYVTKTPVKFCEDVFFGVIPHGNSLEDWLAGGP